MSEAPQFLNVQNHMVHVPSMPRPLRILVGLGVAQVIVGVLTLLFKDANFPAVVVARQGGTDLRMGLPFLFLATVILIVAWTYVLTGALQARWWAAFPILALTTVIVWQTATGDEGWPIAPLALVALWVYFILRKALLRRTRLRTDLLVIGVLIAALNLAVLVLSLGGGRPMWQYPLSVSFQIVGLIGLLIPMLIVAGIDITEVALESSAWVTDRLAAMVPPRLFAAGLIVLAVAKIGLHVSEGSGFSGGLLVALGIVFGLALLSFLLRRGASHHEEPPFWLLLVLSCALVVLPVIVVVAGQFLPTAAQSVSGMNLRFTWSLAGSLATAIALVAILASKVRGKPVDPTFLFVLIYGVWIVLTIGNPISRPASAGSSAGVEVFVTIPELDIAASVGVALAAIALLARRQLHRGTLGFLTAALFSVSLLSGVNSLYEQQFSFSDLLVLLQAAVLLAVPALELGRAMRGRPSGRVTKRGPAFALFALALAALAVVLVLLGGALHLLPGDFALPQDSAAVVILALALLWDFLMSGERFTNHHGTRLPRSARLLLYVGYVLLTSAVLLWTNTLAGGSQDVFNEDILPRYGLVMLGMPMIFYLWVLGGSHLWSGHGAAHSTEGHGEG